MAIDKAIDSSQLESDLTGVANAIRAKDGTSASLAFPAGFISAIEAITSGGSYGDFELLDTISVSEAVSQIAVTIPSGYAELAISFDLVTSASGKTYFYHDSLATQRGLAASNTTANPTGIFVVCSRSGHELDGKTLSTQTVAFSGTNTQTFAALSRGYPSTIYVASNVSGATINSGTIKVYGR